MDVVTRKVRLAGAGPMKLAIPVSTLALETRQRTTIENRLDRTTSIPGANQMIEDHKKKFKSAVHRPTGPCRTYNCHGLTFAARRTWVGGGPVLTIINEDDYKEISYREVVAGDIVVYYAAGHADHSGIVVQRDGFGPLVLSKWGECHEVIHRTGDCPYSDCEVKFYRIEK